jgi:hypothetical protein
MEFLARTYINDFDKNDNSACLNFLNSTLLGVVERPSGLKGIISSFLGNAHHLWIWDIKSLSEELLNVGFKQIRVCEFNDSEDKMFKHVEDVTRFQNAVAIECKK